MVTSRLCILLFLAAIWAVSSKGQSLGDIARVERARKQSATQTFSDEDINLTFQIPAAWEVTPARGGQHFLSIQCARYSEGQCSLWIRASALAKNKQTISDQDRRNWEQGSYSGRDLKKMSAQDLIVAGCPAYQVDFAGASSATRSRIVYVLAHDAGQLYQFEFFTAGTAMEHFDEYADTLQSLLDSMRPVHSLLIQQAAPAPPSATDPFMSRIK